MFVTRLLILLTSSSLVFSTDCPSTCSCYGDNKWSCANVTSVHQIQSSTSHRVENLALTNASMTEDWSFEHFVSLKKLAFFESEELLSERVLKSLPPLAKIFSPNNTISCKQALLANIATLKKVVHNFDKLLCRPLRLNTVSEYIVRMQEMNDYCPTHCKCSPLTSNFPSPHEELPQVYVDCSYETTSRQLKELPSTLPSNFSLFLNMTGNKVKDISLLTTNYAIYQHVTHLSLQDNQVQDLDILFESEWMNSFSYLNLAGNQLYQLLVTVKEDRITSNTHTPTLLLGRNPWHCTCQTVTNIVQVWFEYHIEDFQDVRCTDGTPILFVPANIACMHEHTYSWQYFIFRSACIGIICLCPIGIFRFFILVWRDLNYFPSQSLM